MSQGFTTDDERMAAIRHRDGRADGHFVFSVSTTGVFCRPSCAARPARPEHIGLHADVESAVRAGFRACKRCRPDQASNAERAAAVVAAACRAIESAEAPLPLATLAASAGLSPGSFHRLFRQVCGVPPGAYARAERARRVSERLAEGSGVTEAIYDAGFNSSGRFYEAADGILGMTPTAFRAGGAGVALKYASAPCSLGHVLVAITGRGVCAILLGDDAAALEADLAARFPEAERRPAEDGLSEVLARVVGLVDQPRRATELPLDIQGTAFQRRVWAALQAIPPGETRSYREVAESIGAPRSSRAVAAACGGNRLAVAVPCHRVVAADGSLSGYRWGTGRKRALLDRERA